MNRRDITIGMTVYHNIFTHWGPGIVQRMSQPNLLESLFESKGYRVLVLWSHHPDPLRVQLKEIRKTPNRKKIRSMVALYQMRGVDAKDGGDRLILPKELVK